MASLGRSKRYQEIRKVQQDVLSPRLRKLVGILFFSLSPQSRLGLPAFPPGPALNTWQYPCGRESIRDLYGHRPMF